MMVHYRLLLLFLPLLLVACNGSKNENEHLKQEIRMVTEENNFLKAKIVGLEKSFR